MTNNCQESVWRRNRIFIIDSERRNRHREPHATPSTPILNTKNLFKNTKYPCIRCHMSSTACQQPNRIVRFKPTHSFRHKSSQHTRTGSRTPLLRCSACAEAPSPGRCSVRRTETRSDSVAWQSPSAGRNVAPLVSRLVSRGRRLELLAGVFRARAGERCNLVSVCVPVACQFCLSTPGVLALLLPQIGRRRQRRNSN